MTGVLETMPANARGVAGAVAAETGRDPRILGLTVGGSAVTGTMDEFSDLDFVVVCRDDAHREVLGGAFELARRVGPLLSAFTADHLGEPRLLIALYGPPLLHVDLKFVSWSELAGRVEDGLVVWERDGALTAALEESAAVWPDPDPQWIEDRFWVWIHYAASKLGRGELFECLDAVTYLRSAVLGPLLAIRAGQRAQGVRRLERLAPGSVEALEATVGDHSPEGCASALRSTVALYRRLREGSGVVRRSEAESAAVAYLDGIGPRRRVNETRR